MKKTIDSFPSTHHTTSTSPPLSPNSTLSFSDMSADPSTEPKVEDDDIFSGLKKKKKSKKTVEEVAPEESNTSPAEPDAANEAAAEDGEENMFADLKKKFVQCSQLTLVVRLNPRDADTLFEKADVCVVFPFSSLLSLLLYPPTISTDRKKKKAAPVDLLGNVSSFISTIIPKPLSQVKQKSKLGPFLTSTCSGEPSNAHDRTLSMTLPRLFP